MTSKRCAPLIVTLVFASIGRASIRHGGARASTHLWRNDVHFFAQVVGDGHLVEGDAEDLGGVRHLTFANEADSRVPLCPETAGVFGFF